MSRNVAADRDGENAALMTRLHDVARQGRTHYARHLLKTGLYAGQEKIIELLAAHDAMTPGAIARDLGVRPPTITKTIGRLEEQGFVTRTSSDSDGRQVTVRLTTEGHAILDAMKKALRKAEKQALKGIKKKDRKQLEKILEHIEENLLGRDASPDRKRDAVIAIVAPVEDDLEDAV